METRWNLLKKGGFFMDEKNTNTIAADWCKTASPKLARFNQAFTRRSGKGFARVIILKAEKEEDITYCFEKEKTFFEEYGWACIFVSDDMMLDDKASTDDMVLLFRTKSIEGEVFNEFTVDGVNPQYDSLEPVIQMIGFTDLTMDLIRSLDMEQVEHLSKEVALVGADKFVNDLLMDHYEKTDSDYMTPDDHVTLFGSADVIAKEQATVGSFENDKKEDDNEVDPDQPAQSCEKERKETKPEPYEEGFKAHSISKGSFLKKDSTKQKSLKANQGNLKTKWKETKQNPFKSKEIDSDSKTEIISESDDTKPDIMPVAINQARNEALTSDALDANTEDKKDESTESETKSITHDEMKDTPTPVPVKKIQIQSKEILSEETKIENKALLQNIRSQYEDTLQFIKDLHNPQFTIFINLFSEALEHNVYTKQLCPTYLDISTDVSTELYARLYELDKVTIEFNKKLVHQTIHLGCPFCATEWDEDVTFLENGLHYTRCPKCDNERPFMKEV